LKVNDSFVFDRRPGCEGIAPIFEDIELRGIVLDIEAEFHDLLRGLFVFIKVKLGELRQFIGLQYAMGHLLLGGRSHKIGAQACQKFLPDSP
jgi:hypothetical protein